MNLESIAVPAQFNRSALNQAGFPYVLAPRSCDWDYVKSIPDTGANFEFFEDIYQAPDDDQAFGLIAFASKDQAVQYAVAANTHALNDQGRRMILFESLFKRNDAHLEEQSCSMEISQIHDVSIAAQSLEQA